MKIQINEIHNYPILEEERAFFAKHKKIFIQTFKYVYKQHFNCKNCVLSVDAIANNFYNALYNTEKDIYKKQLCCFFRMKENGLDPGFLYSELTHELINSFTNQERDSLEIIVKIKKIIQVCQRQQILLQEMLNAPESGTLENENFNLITNIALQTKEISYFKNLCTLERNIKFFLHTEVGTSMSYAKIVQIGNSSLVLCVSDEQLSMLALPSNAFILKNQEDEKNFSASAKILCPKEATVILENIKELESLPLLSRKFPRAKIIHTSLVHIANENEYLSGNMIDISEGGIGIISSSKSSFEKGQNIVAFVSYEDPDRGFKFNFETTGHVTSIIGSNRAFRYGISLNLNQEEKSLIRHLLG